MTSHALAPISLNSLTARSDECVGPRGVCIDPFVRALGRIRSSTAVVQLVVGRDDTYFILSRRYVCNVWRDEDEDIEARRYFNKRYFTRRVD